LHKGEDAEFYLRKGFSVIAFEADPQLIAGCRKRLKQFLDSGQLTIVEGAIVEPELIRSGQKKVRFYRNTGNSVWGTVNADWAKRNVELGTSTNAIEVDAINFADEIRKHGMPHFMKIDVEGCDTVCLRALGEFEERPTYISIESDKTSFKNIESEINLFSKLGYTSFQAVEQSMIPQSQSLRYPPREGKYVAHGFERESSGLFGSELEGKWKSRRAILRQYRIIRLGYFFFGDRGIAHKWKFRGSSKVRSLIFRLVRLFTRAAVPGWYDTHARHRCANIDKAKVPQQ